MARVIARRLVTGLTGPSGSGKTSLIRVLSGLIVPDSGTVHIGNTPVRDVRSRAGRAIAGRIGVVFQSPRAAIVRTLAYQPDVIVCDEVTAALDPRAGAAVMRMLQAVAATYGRAVLVLSHDHRLLECVADGVVTMDDLTRGARPGLPAPTTRPEREEGRGH